MSTVVDHIPGDNQPEIRDVEDAGIVGVAVADLDNHEIVSFEGQTVAWDRHRYDRRRRNPSVHFVPENWASSDVGVHLRDRSRGSDNTGPEPLCQESGGEPVIAVAVGDEDVS